MKRVAEPFGWYTDCDNCYGPKALYRISTPGGERVRADTRFAGLLEQITPTSLVTRDSSQSAPGFGAAAAP